MNLKVECFINSYQRSYIQKYLFIFVPKCLRKRALDRLRLLTWHIKETRAQTNQKTRLKGKQTIVFQDILVLPVTTAVEIEVQKKASKQKKINSRL